MIGPKEFRTTHTREPLFVFHLDRDHLKVGDRSFGKAFEIVEGPFATDQNDFRYVCKFSIDEYTRRVTGIPTTGDLFDTIMLDPNIKK